MEVSKKDQGDGKQDGHGAVQARIERTKDVPAVELGRRQKIEGSRKKANPGGTPDGMNQETGRRDAGMEQDGENAEQQRNSEDEFGLRCVGKIWNALRVQNTVGQRGNRQNKTRERAGCAHIEQGPCRANRGTNQNECSECADK